MQGNPKVGQDFTVEVNFPEGKIVGMTLYNESGPTPVPAPTVRALNVHNTLYRVKFNIPTAGPYTVEKLVYLDGPMTEIDDDQGTASESFVVEDPTTLAGTIANAVWNFDLSIFSIPSTLAGYLLFTVPGISSVAAAVWNALRSSYHLVGSFGEALQGVLSVQRANNLDNLDTPISVIAANLISPENVIIGTVEDLQDVIGTVEDLDEVVGETDFP